MTKILEKERVCVWERGYYANKNSDSLMKAHFILLLSLCAGTKRIQLGIYAHQRNAVPTGVALMQVVISFHGYAV